MDGQQSWRRHSRRGVAVATLIAAMAALLVGPAAGQPAPARAQAPAAQPALTLPPPPPPPTELPRTDLYTNVFDVAGRHVSVSLVYNLDARGNILKRLALVDVTPGSMPRGIQRVFEPGTAQVTLGPERYNLTMTEIHNADRQRADLQITLALLILGPAGREMPGPTLTTTLTDLAELRVRQAREANLRVDFWGKSYWAVSGFFGSQSGYLFFDDAMIKRLDDRTLDPMLVEPRYIVMTTERRGVFDERLADELPIGASGYVVAWDPGRLLWVAKRAGQ